MGLIFHHYKTSHSVGGLSEVGHALNSPFALSAGSYYVTAHAQLFGGSARLETQNLTTGEWELAHPSVEFDDYTGTKSMAKLSLRAGTYRVATSGAAKVLQTSMRSDP